MKPGLTKKFRKYWSGLYKVLGKVSELNYEVISNADKKTDRTRKSAEKMLQPKSLEP